MTDHVRALPAVGVIAEANQSAPWTSGPLSAQVEEFIQRFRILLMELLAIAIHFPEEHLLPARRTAASVDLDRSPP